MESFTCAACGWQVSRGPIQALAARHRKSCVSTSTRCVRGGVVAVDPKKCPTLYRSLMKGLALSNGWQEVVILRAAGKDDSADRVARKLMGVESKTMSEETKAKLREYAETHKDEITERRRAKARIRAVHARR